MSSLWPGLLTRVGSCAGWWVISPFVPVFPGWFAEFAEFVSVFGIKCLAGVARVAHPFPFLFFTKVFHVFALYSMGREMGVPGVPVAFLIQNQW